MKAIYLAAATVILAGCAAGGIGEGKQVGSPLEVKMKSLDGKDLDLAKFKGRVILVVNVASKCGYTPQYEGLQALCAKHEKDGLVILGSGAPSGSRLTTWIANMRCLAPDFNHDGQVNSQDFFDFLIPFFAADPSADFNRDGKVNSSDLFDYLDAFFTACR